MTDGRKINDQDFDEAMRCLRSAWHEHEELSRIPEPSEEAREAIVAAVIVAIISRGYAAMGAGLANVHDGKGSGQ